MTDMPEHEESELMDWSRKLTQALQILDLEVDHRLLAELAQKSSALVSPAAGATSAFLVGYAAGLTATSGHKESAAAVESAASTVFDIIDKGRGEQSARGWTGSAQ